MPTLSQIFRFIAYHTPKLSKRGLWACLWVAFLLALINLLGLLVLELTGHKATHTTPWVLTLADWLAAVLLLGLVVALLAEYVLLQRLRWQTQAQLHITRHLPTNLPVSQVSHVTLIAHCANLPAYAKVSLMDRYPSDAVATFLPIVLSAEALNTQVMPDDPASASSAHQPPIRQLGSKTQYELTPSERGHAQFDGVDVQLTTRLGLMSLQFSLPEVQIAGSHATRVLADFRGMFSGSLYAAAQKSALGGQLKRRFKGQGQDFHQIRGYIQGDSMRHIDWRATARQGKLMTREFQDEQDQQIVFLLDASQLMRHLPQERADAEFLRSHEPIQPTTPVPSKATLSHLDRALGAMLELANIAKDQGDGVGFISFSGINDKIVPPKKGANLLSYLLNQSFDIKPSTKMPDYIAAAKAVLALQKKRALIILITNTRSTDTTELLDAIALMRAKHLVVVASLYEHELVDVLADSPLTSEQALTYHSVQDHLNRQKHLIASLGQMSHVLAMSCTPDELPKLLVQAYLNIKTQHRI